MEEGIVGIPNFFTDRNLTPSQAFEYLQGAGEAYGKVQQAPVCGAQTH